MGEKEGTGKERKTEGERWGGREGERKKELQIPVAHPC